jgi:predicted N-acyltransferase
VTSDAAPKLHLSIVDDIRTIPAEDWNRLAARDEYSPFLEHEFLASIEESQCAAPETGWYPRHFILKESGRLVAAAPAYVKTHSMGEFVFDQGLAHAVTEMGLPYYPKLVATLPFTPTPAYRFLIDPEYDEQAITKILMAGMKSFTDQAELGSYSILFAKPDWEESLEFWLDSGSPETVSRWSHQYFIWENENYQDFADYTGRFKKGQRRNILRERASLRDAGVSIRVLTGSDLTESTMDDMYDFYRLTNDQFGPWAAFFLNREWFQDIGRRWAHRVLIFAAFEQGEDEAVAMSMVIRKNGTMVGRYWGARRFISNLHFELCYYAPVEYAIREGITRFDPGMGSPHKARRGFRSRRFQSFHVFSNPEVSTLFNSVLPDANRAEQEAINNLDASIPWKTL